MAKQIINTVKKQTADMCWTSSA